VARAQGVGPKLAQRIVTELKGKPLAELSAGGFRPAESAVDAQPVRASVAGEAVAALMGLGVAEPAARRVVEQAVVRLGEDAAPSAVIKAALQELGR
jgi:Holliday junction DNA helicase RuvA